MHRRHSLLVLPLFALLLPTAQRASAAPPEKPNAALPSPDQPASRRQVEVQPTVQARATEVVENELVKPLAAKEARRNRFSRSYIPPQARRVRVLDRERATDGRGAEFVAFTVDERAGVFAPRADDAPARWRADAIVGCVYPARDEVFVKRGDRFFGAGLLLGQKTPAADDTVCHPAVVPGNLAARSG